VEDATVVAAEEAVVEGEAEDGVNEEDVVEIMTTATATTIATTTAETIRVILNLF
jgi:hypothetical protein